MTEVTTADDTEQNMHDIRVISVYATQWELATDPDDDEEHLPLGHLEEFYTIYKDQLPRIILRRDHEPTCLAFQATQDDDRPDSPISPASQGVCIESVQSRLFVLSSDQIVAALDFEIRCRSTYSRSTSSRVIDTQPIIELLDRCAYANLIIDGRPLDDHIALLAEEKDARLVKPVRQATEPFPPERHQIVFATQIPTPPMANGVAADGNGEHAETDEVIKRILYRVQAPDRPEFAEYTRPSGLNDTGKLCAVTPYASLLSNHQEYVENSIFVTVVQAVGTAARFRQIWHRANHLVRAYRRDGQSDTLGTQSREALQFLADELGNLQFDLGFSVETSADLGLLIPSLRITSFHHELHKAMELQDRAETVSRMFSRVDASIQSELTAINIRLAGEAERRRLSWGLAFGVLTFMAIPIGILGAFFGTNGTQINTKVSIFSWHYYGYIYVITGVLTLIPFVIWMLLNKDMIGSRLRSFRRR